MHDSHLQVGISITTDFELTYFSLWTYGISFILLKYWDTLLTILKYSWGKFLCMMLQSFRTWTFGYHFPIGSFWKIFLVGGLKVVLCWLGFFATLKPKIYKCMWHRKAFMMSTHRNTHKNAFYFFFLQGKKRKENIREVLLSLYGKKN